MRVSISFQIIRLVQPTKKKEYLEKGYGHFEIKVLAPVKHKTPPSWCSKIIFKGAPPVCSPSFVIERTVLFSESKKNRTLYLTDDKLTRQEQWKYYKKDAKIITREDISFMVQHELLLNMNVDEDVKNRNDLYALVKPKGSCLTEKLQLSPLFTALDMQHTCEYFRAELERPLIGAFCSQKVCLLEAKELKKLLAMYREKPWKCCFEHYSKPFKLHPVKYSKMKNALVNIEPLLWTTIRLYNFVLQERKERSREVWDKLTIFQEYLSNPFWKHTAFYCNDHKFAKEAVEKLIEIEMFEEAVPDKPNIIGLVKDVNKNNQLIYSLTKIVRNNAVNSGLNLRTGNAVPSIPSPYLTYDQKRFVKHVLRNPISILEGGPGTGKTEVLVALMAELSTSLVVTYVGMMVDALQKRFGNRIETAHTIHSIIFTRMHNKSAKEWLKAFDVLIIDEGSNVDSHLMADILSCLKNNRRLVIVGDLGQIYPIKVGAPFRDLMTRYPEHTFSLTENKRVDPSARILAESCARIRRGEKVIFNQHEALQFRTLPNGEIGQQHAAMLEEAILKDFNIKRIEDVMDFQIVTLRNEERRLMNDMMVMMLEAFGILKKPQNVIKIAGGIELFKGQKIQFLKNLKPKNGMMSFDPVKNGELGQIDSVKFIHEGVDVKLTNGKQIFIHSGKGIDPIHIGLGYASTCNKAQGSEWKYVLFCLYQNIYSGFTREYPYVAISRAKKKCIVLGYNEEQIHDMCRYRCHRRETLLEYYLKDNPTWDLPMIPYEDTCLLSEDVSRLQILDTQYAVPALEQFVPPDDNNKKKKRKMNKNNNNDTIFDAME